MKKHLVVALFVSVVIGLGLSSCKYDESGLSLRTKTARLTGEWDVVKIGGENMESGEALRISFEKDGDVKFEYSYTYEGTTISESNNGKWEWKDKKKKIEINMDNDNDKEDFEIIKLTNEEFWFDNKDNDRIKLEKI